MPQDKSHEKVQFQYREGHGYRLIHVSGARGAATPGGLIKVDLFSEYGIAPSEEVYALTAQGTIGERIAASPKPEGIEVVRELQIGVVVSPRDAEAIAKWLLDKVEEARTIKKAAADAAADKE